MKLGNKNYYFVISLCTYISIVPLSFGANEKEHISKKEQHIREYIVQSDDTLMFIAFKIYGDYRRWKDLVKLNPRLSRVNLNVHENEKIKFEIPNEMFITEPLGEPYVIKSGDTLASISYLVYKTHKRWDEIYQNNRQLIRRPDLIFAGFTIYYAPIMVNKKNIELK